MADLRQDFHPPAASGLHVVTASDMAPSAISWPEPGPDTHAVQAAAEGAAVDGDGTIEFMGQRFRLAESIGMMPLLAFANAGKNGLDSDTMEGMAAMYALIRDTVDQTRIQKRNADGTLEFDAAGDPVWDGPSEWQRFERHAIETKADDEALLGFINRATEMVAARPRKRRGDSSTSSPEQSASSRGSSSRPSVPPGFEGITPVADIGR